MAHGVRRSVLLKVPACSALQRYGPVVDVCGDCLRNENVPVQGALHRRGDFRVTAGVVAEDFDFEVLRKRTHAMHALGGILGGPLLGVGVDRSEQRDSAFVDRHSDLRGVHLRIPGELGFNVFFQLDVGLGHGLLQRTMRAIRSLLRQCIRATRLKYALA